jgi:hypothetical protein
MKQKELLSFYRALLLLLAGAGTVSLLSRVDQPWAKAAAAIGSIAVFLAVAGFVVFVTFRQFRQFVNAPAPARDEPLPSSLYLAYWHRLAWLAVTASVVQGAILVAVLLFVEPPQQCPNWHLPDEHLTPLWLPFLVFTVPLIAALIFMVACWKWLIRKAIESTDYANTIPVPYVLAITVMWGCVMSLLPWFLLVSKCDVGW